MPVYATYTKAFREDALNLVGKGEQSISQIARDLGMSHWVLRRWCKGDLMKRKQKRKAARIDVAGGPDETAEQRIARLEREVTRLRKENEDLRTDKEILKKAAAFFAKESK